MKYHDTYAQGWTKLVHLLESHDKAYALGLYRLLAETIEDQAYALKLEADLLWYFKDEHAYEKYEEAAQEYQDQNNLRAALGVYEQLIDLDPQQEYIQHRERLLNRLQES